MDEIYEMALEMLEPVEEIAFGKGAKALFSQKTKEGKDAMKEARKLKKAGEKAKAKKKYQEALKLSYELRKEVEKIEDETVPDWIISLFLKPWWFFLSQAIEADLDFNGLTRQSTLKYIDRTIDMLKREMNSI